MCLVHIKVAETGRDSWIDTDSAKVRRTYSEWFSTLSQKEGKLFNKYQIDSVDIATDQDYVKGLMALFQHK